VIHAQAAELLLKEMKQKFDVIVLDIPRHLRTFSRQCLSQADQVVLVSELSLVAVRDCLRLSDMLRDNLHMRPPLIVGNRVGLSKFDMKLADFEKGIEGKLAAAIAFSPSVFIPPSSDIPAIKFKDTAAIKPFFKLAETLVPEAKTLISSVKAKKGLGGIFGGKKAASEPEADVEAAAAKPDKAEAKE
jgi:Flp pilus assembly CpaE family ATPase